MSLLEKLAAQVTQGSETKKPKIIRGDHLDYQHTLMDLILNVRANPSTNSFAEQMENNERTLKELATPDVEKTPKSI
ncbi:hypothetical protein CR513_16375, partial [Mucuna pruriens]